MTNDSRPRLYPRSSVLSYHRKKKKLSCSFLHQVDFTERPLRWRARTGSVACISRLPLRGLSTGSCAGSVCRKPTSAVSAHTARRCCLLRPLIILRLLSVENTPKDRRACVIHSCGVHLIICHEKGFGPDKTPLRTTMQVSANNRPPHCSVKVVIGGLDNHVHLFIPAQNYTSEVFFIT